MAASDYCIKVGEKRAYITRKEKVEGVISVDSEAISEEVILSLIDWYLDKELEIERFKGLSFVSQYRSGKVVYLCFKDVEVKTNY